jgi:hypothetical protein
MWDYLVIPVPRVARDLESTLNTLGTDRWELISYVEGQLVLKRARQGYARA